MIDLISLRNASLSSHNTYRTTHRSPAMTLQDSLNTTSQSWAEYLAKSGTMQHSSSEYRNGAGENLYVFYTTSTTVSPLTLADKAVASWYNEISAYNYDVPQFSSGTGHFTQVVWKNSTQLGCGAAQGTKVLNGKTYNAYYVVCQYAPAGNITGQFADNVLRP